MRLALLRAPLPKMKLAHKLGSMLDHGPYSHGELVFSDHVTGSSWLKGGVQLRKMPDAHYIADIWDYYSLPDSLEPAARQWFITNKGKPYDVLGPVRFAIGIVNQSVDRYYCHEATAEALSLPDPWRWTGGLFVAMGPKLWPTEFKRVPAPWFTPLPSVFLRCSDPPNELR